MSKGESETHLSVVVDELCEEIESLRKQNAIYRMALEKIIENEAIADVLEWNPEATEKIAREALEKVKK